MNAGLPGIAVGGLFFVISALAMPFVELVRAATGRSSRTRWQMVARQAAMAVAIVLSVERVVWIGSLARGGVTVPPGDGGPAIMAATAGGFAFPVLPLLLTSGCLAGVLLAAYGMLLLHGRATGSEDAEDAGAARRAA